MSKVYIKKFEKRNELKQGYYSSDHFSVDAVKPYDIDELDWDILRPFVEKICDGTAKNYSKIKTQDGLFNLSLIEDEKDWGILAESDNYFIIRSHEDASIYKKPDCRRITCVGDFYGNPQDAYIDSEEKFCITVGCGIIKYYLQEPFDEYMYNRNTTQWVETGREPKNIEWCDKIEEITDSYIIVSCDDEDRRKFSLATLEKKETI